MHSHPPGDSRPPPGTWLGPDKPKDFRPRVLANISCPLPVLTLLRCLKIRAFSVVAPFYGMPPLPHHTTGNNPPSRTLFVLDPNTPQASVGHWLLIYFEG